MSILFNDAARLVLRLADLEAERSQSHCIDTEHLLLGLVQLHDCVAVRVLLSGNIKHHEVRLAVEQRVKRVVECSTDDPLKSEVDCLTDERRRLTPGAEKAIDLAKSAVDRLGHARVGTGHLLLGLLEEAEGVAFHVLCLVGIGRVGNNLSRVAERVTKEMDWGLRE